MSAPVLKVSSLEAHYGPVMAIRGISLEIQAGQIVALLGANGAGKTTLLKTISGVVNPTKGQVEFLGMQVQRKDPDELVRLGLSHVPEGREVFPFLSVHDNLLLGGYTRPHSEIKASLDRAWHYFPKLRELDKSPAGLLSGGEQQMLAIARALMAQPRLILLDEPSLGLSPLLSKNVFAALKLICTEEKIPVLLVEQNASLALGIADHAYVLENGRVVSEGSASQMLAKDDIREFYLGMADEGVRGERRWKRRKTWR